MNRLIFLAGLWGLLQTSGNRALAYEFEVDGVMTYSTKIYPPISKQVQVYVQDDHWAILTANNLSATNRYVKEISSDGENIYVLGRTEANGRPFAPNDVTQALPNSWVGEIHLAPFPYAILDTESITLFYAYASSSYLDLHTNHIGAIPFDPSWIEQREEDSFHAFAIRNTTPPRLPCSLIFLVPFQFKTNDVFTASEFTNLTGLQIPVKVKLTHFSTMRNDRLSFLEFHATRISDKCTLKSFKPVLPDGARVADFRSPYFHYPNMRLATNGWPLIQTE